MDKAWTHTDLAEMIRNMRMQLPTYNGRGVEELDFQIPFCDVLDGRTVDCDTDLYFLIDRSLTRHVKISARWQPDRSDRKDCSAIILTLNSEAALLINPASIDLNENSIGIGNAPSRWILSTELIRKKPDRFLHSAGPLVFQWNGFLMLSHEESMYLFLR